MYIMIWSPSNITNSSRVRQLLSRVNLTGFTTPTSKEEQHAHTHANFFKSWLCPNFLLRPKKSKLPKFWEGCSPPAPPPSISLWTKASLVRGTVNCPLRFLFFISLFPWESVCTREPFARKVCYLSASSTTNLLFYPPRGLSSNNIRKIDNQTFAGLKTLQTLWVNHYNILTLHLGTLTNCQTWQMEYFISAELRAGLDDLESVSQKSRNFSGLFRVPQFPLYLRNAEILSTRALQSSWFFLH